LVFLFEEIPMLVQEYLKSGKTHDLLASELGIKVTRHETLPLVILNYDQIESPKTHPIVRECRGLVLHAETHELVARSFPRFFNWGEVREEMDNFDFSDFHTLSKEDGSLVVLYYFDGQWRANTRGSFGLDNMQYSEFTWQDAFAKALKVKSIKDLNLVKELSYVCEFCSPWNKIVRRYTEPKMYLLTVFHKEKELDQPSVDSLSVDAKFSRPERYNFRSIEEITDFLKKMEKDDATYEGVVICDKKFNRWKVKSATYLGLHKLKGEGDNLFNPKHLVPFILAGEEDELLTYFPEVKDVYNLYKMKVEEAYASLVALWKEHWQIESQKDFALSIGKTPFTGILFTLRKQYGKGQSEELLKLAWRDAGDTVVKFILDKRKEMSENSNQNP
jgi:hypothetical protein